MHELRNDNASLMVHTLGAELRSLKVGAKELMWDANPAWWGRVSPVLFPTVGKSQNDRLMVQGKTYPMAQHGFARDKEFLLDEVRCAENRLSFVLYDDGETLQQYPFPFELRIEYTLLKNGVHVRYEVFNPGNSDMPFALGAHPAFAIDPNYFDALTLQFNRESNLKRHELEKGLFNGEELELVVKDSGSLAIDGSTFLNDALVFKNIESNSVQLYHPDYRLEMQFGGFKDFGIWTKPGCKEFICLEPWHGHAAHVGDTEEAYSRQGLMNLVPNTHFEAFWQVVI